MKEEPCYSSATTWTPSSRSARARSLLSAEMWHPILRGSYLCCLRLGPHKATRRELNGATRRNALLNPWFRPLRFYLATSMATLRVPIRNDDPFMSGFEGEIDQQDVAFTVGYALYDETGILLYWSCSDGRAGRIASAG